MEINKSAMSREGSANAAPKGRLAQARASLNFPYASEYCPNPFECVERDTRQAIQKTVPSDFIIIGGSFVFGLETSAISRPP